jgi:type I restriction enzyme S subunit
MTELPDGWELKRLSDCLEKLESGKKAERGWSPQCLSHPSRDENVWGVLKTTSVQMGEFQPEHNKELPDYLAAKSGLEVNTGDFLVTTTGPRNRCGIVCHVKKTRRKLIFSGKILRFRVNESVILPNWLMYLLMSPEYQSTLDKMKVGTSESSVSIGNQQILDLEIFVPPIGEQHKIVELLEDRLSRLDSALADVKQAKIKASQFRMSVLHSVFNSATNTADWDRTTLEKIGVWKTGSTPLSKNPEFQGVDVKFVTPGDIYFGGKLGSVARTISNQGADSVRRVTPPSVHLVCIGTIGKVAWTNEMVTTNQQINSLEVDASKNNAEFLMWLIASPEIQEKLWANSSSTTVPILNKGKLEKIACSIPSLETQNEVMRFIDSSFAKLDAVVKTVHLMENHSSILRRSLLQAAFTGQLTNEVISV